MHGRHRWHKAKAIFPVVLATVPAVPAHGQEDAPPDAAALREIEAGIPVQPWYPEGYYDIRIAAEAEIAEDPEANVKLVRSGRESGGGFTLNISHIRIDQCRPRQIDPDIVDPVAQLHGDTALEVARLHSLFRRLQYQPVLYEEALLAFERASIERDAGAGGSSDDLRAALAGAVETNRQQLAPELLGVRSMRCTPAVAARPRMAASPPPSPRPPVGIIVRTEPHAGEVLLISAFAFKVCTRKTPDPWDRFACKWNEIQTGAERPLSGRYVYQVKWPDGTVRKGTREIAPHGGPVILRKTGS